MKDKYDSRIRFMLLDVVDLYNSDWQSRKKNDGPKSIQEIHDQAAREQELAKARNSMNHRGHGGGFDRGPPPQRPQVCDTQPSPPATALPVRIFGGCACMRCMLFPSSRMSLPAAPCLPLTSMHACDCGVVTSQSCLLHWLIQCVLHLA